MAISTCRDTIIESFEHSYRKRLEKMLDKRMEKREKRWRRGAVERTLRREGIPLHVRVRPGGDVGEKDAVSTPSHESRPRHAGGRGGGGYRRPGKIVLNEMALTPEMWQVVEQEVEQLRARHHRHGSDNPFCEVGNFHSQNEHRGGKAVGEMINELKSLNATGRLVELLGGENEGWVEQTQRREFMVKASRDDILCVSWSLTSFVS
jgi:potassium channel subfamily K, other eukaryote